MTFAFMNLKGGVGKTKLNSYFATLVAHRGHSVLLMDCDVSQHSTEVLRTDIPEDMNLDIIQYDNRYGNLDDFLSAMQEEYDVVIVDLPGTDQQRGVLPIMSKMDYVVIPTTPEPEDLASSFKFSEMLEEIGVEYDVMMNNYEVQYYQMGVEENSDFSSYNTKDKFNGRMLPKGIRKERSLLQQKFVIGQYGGHNNTKRVEVALEQVYDKMKSYVGK